jgi:hypothetical protein
MHYDWLTMNQSHGERMPRICDRTFHVVDNLTGEVLSESQPRLVHEGSYSTSITIKVTGDNVEVSGNPSRYDRLDNVFGYQKLDDAVEVFNGCLRQLGLPEFTKNTHLIRTTPDKNGKFTTIGDGAKFTRIDICENKAVGEGNQIDFLRGVATQRLRNSVPFLYPNGRTVEWKSAKGGSRLIYSKYYDKSYELRLNLLPKIKRKLGEDSNEYKYAERLATYLESVGAVRAEQEYKSEWLKRNCASWWGLFDESIFHQPHKELFDIDLRVGMTNMTLESIAERLLTEGVVTTAKAAHTTAFYVYEWQHGKVFDLKKSSVKTHRSRLRKIGIDIANPCDISQFSPVFVREAREIEVTPLEQPSWYRSINQKPQLSLVA